MTDHVHETSWRSRHVFVREMAVLQHGSHGHIDVGVGGNGVQASRHDIAGRLDAKSKKFSLAACVPVPAARSRMRPMPGTPRSPKPPSRLTGLRPLRCPSA